MKNAALIFVVLYTLAVGYYARAKIHQQKDEIDAYISQTNAWIMNVSRRISDLEEIDDKLKKLSERIETVDSDRRKEVIYYGSASIAALETFKKIGIDYGIYYQDKSDEFRQKIAKSLE